MPSTVPAPDGPSTGESPRRRTCALVVNPRARHGSVGKDATLLVRQLEELLAPELEVRYRPTQGPRDATRIVREAIGEGVDAVIGVGGDGTFHEVVNGFFDEGRLVRDVPLGLLSRGTGGDTCRTLGIPAEPAAFCAMVRAGRTRRMDLGFAELADAEGRPVRRVFVNIGDVGVSADVVERVNRGSKKLGGFVSYLWGTVTALAGYHPKEIELVLDGAPPTRHLLILGAFANCRYFGGGMQVAPHADPFDGLLDVVVVEGDSRIRLFKNLPRLYKGTHLEVAGVTERRARVVEARSTDPSVRVTLDLDGEQPGALPATLRVLPGALQVYVP